MKHLALTWLNKQVKKTRMDKAHAEERNATPEELQNLTDKINLLEYIIGEITAKEE